MKVRGSLSERCKELHDQSEMIDCLTMHSRHCPGIRSARRHDSPQPMRRVRAAADDTVCMKAARWRLGGVLGGMGPAATIDFLSKVVAVTHATCDQEHVPLIVHQVPQIEDRSSAILQGSDAPLVAMLAGLQRLARAGAQFAVIPCNTAHYWYDRLLELQDLAILHIAYATSRELEQRAKGPARVAILATRGTHHAGIYSGRLAARFEILPTHESVQLLVDRSIRAVKAGDYTGASCGAREAAQRSLDAGADMVILACTELPLALVGAPMAERCVDATLALARLCVLEAMSDSDSRAGTRT